MENKIQIFKLYFIILLFSLNINLSFATVGFFLLPDPLPSPFSENKFKNNYLDNISYNSHWEYLKNNFNWHKTQEDKNIYNFEHSKVKKHLAYLNKHPNYMLDVSTRAEPYLFYLSQEIHKRNLPAELAVLPIVESAFDPYASSSAGAAGLWQIMPLTAKHIGVELNWWFDGRRDIISSTNAALDYIEKLYKDFDQDWLLAIAAYNAGAGTVRKAIRYNQKHNQPTDYWSLRLPRETQKYIPKLLAFIEIINNPSLYNQTLIDLPHRPYFEVVNLDTQIDLNLAAKLSKLDISDIYTLNPGYNHFATGPNGPYHLVLPIENYLNFTENLKKISKNKLVTYKQYKIQKGDSLIKIAKKFNTNTSVIKQLNNLASNTIRINKNLIIPIREVTAIA